MSDLLTSPAKINPDKFALAAAHPFTDRVIATWDPFLHRTPRVLVPVQLDALVVREQGGTWADCLMRPAPDEGSPANRRDLLPPPFTNLEAPRPPGVYLHWALPDALTHGQQSGDSVSFPTVPDRWLVLRYSPSLRIFARRAVRGWVLRTGGETPTVIPLDQWKEQAGEAPPANPLTALGHGDPAWSAYYDNVVNRLGFYDDLSDVRSGPLAYLVCGWYSNPAFDPLGDPVIQSLADFDARMALLRWGLKAGELHEAVRHANKYVKAATLAGLKTREAVVLKAASAEVRAAIQSNPASGVRPEARVGAAPSPLDEAGHPIEGSYTTDGSWWPRLSLYHGAVVGLGWPGIGFPGHEDGLLSGEAGGPPAADQIKVAVGNTMTEALGALVARPETPADETRILEGFMLGALADLDRADGRARLDVRLHASTFGSQDGGSTTERVWVPPMPPHNPNLPANPVAPKPGIFPKKPSVRPAVSETVKASFELKQVVFEKGESIAHLTEVVQLKGRLSEAFGGLDLPPAPTPTPGHYEDVRRSLPRLFYPADPVILLQGGRRAFKHGGDGRYTPDGRLECRLSGFNVYELSTYAAGDDASRVSVRGEDLLERGVENGSIPPECEDLLHETVLIDPGSAVIAAEAALNFAERRRGAAPSLAAPRLTAELSEQVRAQARNFAVEQTSWWAVRDPRVDQSPLVTLSGLAGMLPSPVAVTPPVRPWNPLHLDWKVQFIPSPRMVDDWSLGEIDYQPGEDLPAEEDTQAGVILEGRAHLTGGAAQTIAAGVRKALEQAASSGTTVALPPRYVSRFHSEYAQALLSHMEGLTTKMVAQTGAGDGTGEGTPIDRQVLSDLASALESMDVLAGALDNFHTRLRGNLSGDGASAPAPGDPDPSPFFPLRAGFLRILRLRLVDGFGQAVDLAGSSDAQNVDSQQVTSSQPMSLDGRPDLQVLPPRFTSPARLWFRYYAADGSDREAGAAAPASPDAGSTAQPADTPPDVISPVCGYLLPDHLDGELEFFAADGSSLGAVRPDPGAGVIWADAPGRPTTVGQTPARAASNAFLAGIAQGLLEWGAADTLEGPGRETALSALLRMIDSTLWSVDPFAHAGEEYLSLLIGHPVAVLRARVWLELREPVHPEVTNQIAISLRLGALTHWQDGLLGYYVNDDYRTLHCADGSAAGFARPVGPGQGFLQQAGQVQNYYETFADDLGAGAVEGASPVDHPFVDASGVAILRPNQPLNLTLLVEPHAVVHATTGLLPRKEIGIRREWVALALAKLSPTFRFGPVLTDLKHIRMPVPNERSGTWSWDHRQDVSAWAEDPVTNATNDAPLSPDPVQGTEGWLRLVPPEPTTGANA